MARSEKLTVAEALAQAQLIDLSLKAWQETAPGFVASVGGTDALARMCEMTCIGPVPRLDSETWQRASDEHLERWEQSAAIRRLAVPLRVAEPDLDLQPAPATPPRRRSVFGFFNR